MTSAKNPPRRLTVIEAPSALGLRPPSPGAIPGTRLGPASLIDAGLLSNLPVSHHIRLPEPRYAPELDPQTGVRNLDQVVKFSHALASVIGAALDDHEFPFVLGGDCSLLLGAALALRNRGDFGLVHLDGHDDFSQSSDDGRFYPNVAGADLAIVSGRGPKALTHLAGQGPYFRDENIIQLGARTRAAEIPSQCREPLPETAIYSLPMQYILQETMSVVLKKTATRLASRKIDGWWLHIDVDILSVKYMPAVDSPDSTGLNWSQFSELTAALLALPGLVGLNVGIYDPSKDPTQRLAKKLSGILSKPLHRLSKTRPRRNAAPSRLGKSRR